MDWKLTGEIAGGEAVEAGMEEGGTMVSADPVCLAAGEGRCLE